MKHTFLFVLAILVISCGPGKEKQAINKSGTLLVSTVNYPLFYFAERIGADLIRVEFPAPKEVDPAYWIPDDKALDIYQSSDLILANGADYAKWMHNVSLPSSRIITTSSKVENKYIEIHLGASHSHGPEGEHVHKGFAFTTWLDFQVAAAQAESVKEALVARLPDSREIIETNYQILENELLGLHTAMKELSEKTEGEYLIGSHPVYQYLTEAYNLNIHSVHFEPGEMPSEDQWKEFDELVKHHPSGTMLWEDEPLPEVKSILLEKGIEARVFNPCGNRPGKGDFLDVMRTNIKLLESAVER